MIADTMTVVVMVEVMTVDLQGTMTDPDTMIDQGTKIVLPEVVPMMVEDLPLLTGKSLNPNFSLRLYIVVLYTIWLRGHSTETMLISDSYYDRRGDRSGAYDRREERPRYEERPSRY